MLEEASEPACDHGAAVPSAALAAAGAPVNASAATPSAAINGRNFTMQLPELSAWIPGLAPTNVRCAGIGGRLPRSRRPFSPDVARLSTDMYARSERRSAEVSLNDAPDTVDYFSP
ncbi:hypothetical protein Afil01_14640 [Actinorhabdospora filicis]|uniref:Uncharacterized protein n=1 Tax=Actinorhabdospora filicis TaxID=1785913 RepID=A0A9W6W261_9ACTN|nr:hypothetical protein Afil01_14640 [Actinorhabdospora filicis]